MMNTRANVFAAHLLMPEELLGPWLKKNPPCLDDDNWVDRCARKFAVPRALVVFRLMQASS